jgi:hypothetical protein
MTQKPNLKGMNAKQIAWWNEKNATMEAIEDAWHHDRTLAYSLFTEDFRRQIDIACARLNIKLALAWDMDGWDGERDANIITKSRELEAIRRKLAGETIPADWYVSQYDASSASTFFRRR